MVNTLADSALKFEMELKSYGSHPHIIESLIMTIHDRGQSSFINNIPPITNDMTTTLYDLIRDPSSKQDQIGFYLIFEGHVSKNGELHRNLPTVKRIL